MLNVRYVLTEADPDALGYGLIAHRMTMAADKLAAHTRTIELDMYTVIVRKAGDVKLVKVIKELGVFYLSSTLNKARKKLVSSTKVRTSDDIDLFQDNSYPGNVTVRRRFNRRWKDTRAEPATSLVLQWFEGELMDSDVSAQPSSWYGWVGVGDDIDLLSVTRDMNVGGTRVSVPHIVMGASVADSGEKNEDDSTKYILRLAVNLGITATRDCPLYLIERNLDGTRFVPEGGVAREILLESSLKSAGVFFNSSGTELSYGRNRVNCLTEAKTEDLATTQYSVSKSLTYTRSWAEGLVRPGDPQNYDNSSTAAQITSSRVVTYPLMTQYLGDTAVSLSSVTTTAYQYDYSSETSVTGGDSASSTEESWSWDETLELRVGGSALITRACTGSYSKSDSVVNEVWAYSGNYSFTYSRLGFHFADLTRDVYVVRETRHVESGQIIDAFNAASATKTVTSRYTVFADGVAIYEVDALSTTSQVATAYLPFDMLDRSDITTIAAGSTFQRVEYGSDATHIYYQNIQTSSRVADPAYANESGDYSSDLSDQNSWQRSFLGISKDGKRIVFCPNEGESPPMLFTKKDGVWSARDISQPGAPYEKMESISVT